MNELTGNITPVFLPKSLNVLNGRKRQEFLMNFIDFIGELPNGYVIKEIDFSDRKGCFDSDKFFNFNMILDDGKGNNKKVLSTLRTRKAHDRNTIKISKKLIYDGIVRAEKEKFSYYLFLGFQWVSTRKIFMITNVKKLLKYGNVCGDSIHFNLCNIEKLLDTDYVFLLHQNNGVLK